MSLTKSVLFVSPKNDDLYRSIDSGYEIESPPLGLLLLREALRQNLPEVEVTVLDERYTPDLVDKAIRDPKYGAVGISRLYYNSQQALRTARIVREYNPNATIVKGNVDAAAHAENLLRKNLVDYVVRGGGEGAMVEILRGNIPRLDSAIYVPFDLNRISRISFEGFDQQMFPYDSTRKNYNSTSISPFPIACVRGCIKAMQKGPCSFCTTPYSKLTLMKPQKFWEGVSHLFEGYGVNYFFETGDDVLVGNYPKQLLRARPRGLEGKVSFRFYTGLDFVDSESMGILKGLNTKTAFPGLENVNQTVLFLMGKLYSTLNFDEIGKLNFESIHKKFSLFAKAGIDFYIPILLGGQGESKFSLEQNKEFARQALDRFGGPGEGEFLRKMYVGMVIPTAGSRLYNLLVGNEKFRRDYSFYHEKIHGNGDSDILKTVNPDYFLMMRLMPRYLSEDLTFEQIQNTINQIREMSSRKFRQRERNVPTNFGENEKVLNGPIYGGIN